MTLFPREREDQIPDKSYFRIGEVSRIVGVEPYVIRYWESEFKTVRPHRTKSDQRLYRRKDVMELLHIKYLLYNELYTIAGARKRLAGSRSNREAPGGTVDEDRQRLAEVKKTLLEIRSLLLGSRLEL